MTVDHDERAAMISATIANYKSGEFGDMRARSLLVMCGLNASEIEELLAPIRSEAFKNYTTLKRGCVR